MWAVTGSNRHGCSLGSADTSCCCTRSMHDTTWAGMHEGQEADSALPLHALEASQGGQCKAKKKQQPGLVAQGRTSGL
jgi:hypothetical protein